MNDKYRNLKFHAKISLIIGGPKFGPGVAQLMELVEETHSVNQACKKMGMAYSKAWKIINAAQADLGFSLIQGTAGGKGGGGSALTPEGRELLTRYQDFCQEADEHLQELFYKHFLL